MAEPLTQVNVTGGPDSKPSSAKPSSAKAAPLEIKPKPGNVFFDDGKRRIDYVLVFEKDEPEPENKEKEDEAAAGSSSVFKRFENLPRIGEAARSDEEREKLRLFFESNLVAEGLELEEDVRKEEDGRMTIFIKLHAPWVVLLRQAELLRIKMPLKLKDSFVQEPDTLPPLFSDLDKRFRKIWTRCKEKFTEITHRGPDRPHTATVKDGESKAKLEPKRVTWAFRRKKLDRFDIGEHSAFFSPTQRMEMIWELMQKVRNDPDDEKKRGIELLLHTGIYEAAFPLHDAGEETVFGAGPLSEWPQRQVLRHSWASWKAIFKHQPLDLVRR